MIYTQYRNHHRLLIQLLLFFMLLLTGVNANAFDRKATEALIEKQCATCHKFEGKGESRFTFAFKFMAGRALFFDQRLCRFSIKCISINSC